MTSKTRVIFPNPSVLGRFWSGASHGLPRAMRQGIGPGNMAKGSSSKVKVGLGSNPPARTSHINKG